MDVPFETQDPAFRERVETSFSAQAVMRTIGAELTSVEPGRVTIRLGFRDDLTQQHGFLHAGVLGIVLDSACGYASFSLMGPDESILTVENKLNLFRPALGPTFEFRGEVIKPGRTIIVSEGRAFSNDGTLLATMTATNMAVAERPDVTEPPG